MNFRRGAGLFFVFLFFFNAFQSQNSVEVRLDTTLSIQVHTKSFFPFETKRLVYASDQAIDSFSFELDTRQYVEIKHKNYVAELILYPGSFSIDFGIFDVQDSHYKKHQLFIQKITEPDAQINHHMYWVDSMFNTLYNTAIDQKQIISDSAMQAIFLNKDTLDAFVQDYILIQQCLYNTDFKSQKLPKKDYDLMFNRNQKAAKILFDKQFRSVFKQRKIRFTLDSTFIHHRDIARSIVQTKEHFNVDDQQAELMFLSMLYAYYHSSTQFKKTELIKALDNVKNHRSLKYTDLYQLAYQMFTKKHKPKDFKEFILIDQKQNVNNFADLLSDTNNVFCFFDSKNTYALKALLHVQEKSKQLNLKVWPIDLNSKTDQNLYHDAFYMTNLYEFIDLVDLKAAFSIMTNKQEIRLLTELRQINEALENFKPSKTNKPSQKVGAKRNN